jgi:hypothetical protein
MFSTFKEKLKWEVSEHGERNSVAVLSRTRDGRERMDYPG